MSGVELQPRCRKARCNYQDVATWMIGYIVDAIGISITNMSFAILGCYSRYHSCGKKIMSTRAKAIEGDAMSRFIGAVRFFITHVNLSFINLFIASCALKIFKLKNYSILLIIYSFDLTRLFSMNLISSKICNIIRTNNFFND